MRRFRMTFLLVLLGAIATGAASVLLDHPAGVARYSVSADRSVSPQGPYGQPAQTELTDHLGGEAALETVEKARSYAFGFTLSALAGSFLLLFGLIVVVDLGARPAADGRPRWSGRLRLRNPASGLLRR